MALKSSYSQSLQAQGFYTTSVEHSGSLQGLNLAACYAFQLRLNLGRKLCGHVALRVVYALFGEVVDVLRSQLLVGKKLSE